MDESDDHNFHRERMGVCQFGLNMYIKQTRWFGIIIILVVWSARSRVVSQAAPDRMLIIYKNILDDGYLAK